MWRAFADESQVTATFVIVNTKAAGVWPAAFSYGDGGQRLIMKNKKSSCKYPGGVL